MSTGEPSAKRQCTSAVSTITSVNGSFMIDNPPDMNVKIGTDTFQAHSSQLRMFSQCARGLPEDSQEWPLDSLTIFDGKPPAPSVVGAWLEAVYFNFDGKHAPKNLKEAVLVVQFADAVGSPTGLMNAIINNLPNSKLCLELASSSYSTSRPLILSLTGGFLYLVDYACSSYHIVRVHRTCFDEKDLEKPDFWSSTGYSKLTTLHEQRYSTIKQQAVKDLEELMYVAYKLKLQKLSAILQAFVHEQLRAGAGRFMGHGFFAWSGTDILTARVCSVLDPQQAVQGWLRWMTKDDSQALPGI